MPRPTTKEDLLILANKNISQLNAMIDALPIETQTGNFMFDAEAMGSESHWKRDKNIRDVIVHLYEWHQLLLKWVQSNLNGEKTSFFPEPYNFRTYPELNVKFWEKHQSTTFEQARLMLKDSHENVISLLNTFSDEQLFTKKFYSWTGTSNLGSYFISTTSSHYDWAIKKVKAHIKSFK